MMDRQLNKGSRNIVNAVRFDARVISLLKGLSFPDPLQDSSGLQTTATDCIQFIRQTNRCRIILTPEVEAGKAC